MIAAVIKELKQTWRYKYAVQCFVISTLKLRYRRTVLGFLWSLLGPMLNYLVIAIVFQFMMKGAIKNYATFMFAGSLIFTFMSGVIARSTSILISYEHYIKKIYVPKLVFVMDVVLTEFVNFILSFMSLLILGLIFKRVSIDVNYISLLPVLFSVLMFVTGLSTIFAILGVYFRDLIHIVPIVLQAFFFFTPVMYDTRLVPLEFARYMKFNPFMYFVEAFRAPIYGGVVAGWKVFALIGFMGVVLFVSSLFILKKFDNRIVFRL